MLYQPIFAITLYKIQMTTAIAPDPLLFTDYHFSAQSLAKNLYFYYGTPFQLKSVIAPAFLHLRQKWGFAWRSHGVWSSTVRYLNFKLINRRSKISMNGIWWGMLADSVLVCHKVSLAWCCGPPAPDSHWLMHYTCISSLNSQRYCLVCFSSLLFSPFYFIFMICMLICLY